jgi:tetratricopeptide (TPR) repeat protein
MTKAGILALLALPLAVGADEQQTALEKKAKSSFDRVMLSSNPQLTETILCVQDQAALAPVAARDDAPLVYFRKGYCALIAAAAAENAAGFQDAAAAFDQAVSSWPGRLKAAKGASPEPAPSVLMALSGIARLGAGAEDGGTREDLLVGVARSVCSPELLSADACQAVFRIGREWLGWMALRRGDVKAAAGYLADQPDSVWTHWAKGRRAFAEGRFRDAAIEYGASLELWRARQSRWKSDWMARLGPQPRMGAALTDLGGALMLAGETAAAVSTLSAALDAEPRNARACYLRGRAKELAGQAEAATADYNLAVRTAFAGAENLVSGEARLYRGILLYRRKDFPRAEDEFSSALNEGIPADLRADTVAWRHMAAVAGGACSVSPRLLGESLAAVSPYFPKTDARAAMVACPGVL